jgi:hypothetical protein
MVKRIFKSLAWKKLNKFHKASRRSAGIHNISTAKSIGVLWFMDDKKSSDNYEQLRKKLKSEGINVYGLAFIDDSHDKDIFEKATTSKIIDESEIGIWGEPKTDDARQFMKRHFDILIDLSLTKLLSLSYIVVHSNASFKIGWRWPENNYNDFSIETVEKPEGAYLSEQLFFYLERINKKE